MPIWFQDNEHQFYYLTSLYSAVDLTLQSTTHQSWRSIICLNAVTNGSKRAVFWHSPSNLFSYLPGLHHHSYLSAVINEFINLNVLCVILPCEGEKCCAGFAERTGAGGRGTRLVSHRKSPSGARSKANSCEPQCRATIAPKCLFSTSEDLI